MKRISVLLSLLLIILPAIFAQDSFLKQANRLYAEGKYIEAAQQYEKIGTIQGEAPELYYNIGNSYFKSNELGLSILNYERALRLAPGFEDAKNNLELAQQKVVDNIVQPPTFFLGRWIVGLIKVFSSDNWFYISFGAFVFCLFFIFLFIFGNSRRTRKTSFYVGSLLLSVFLITIFFSAIRKEQMSNRNNAVVMVGLVIVKSSPDDSGTDLFQLHEGTKVRVHSILGKWVEIKLGNGSLGWVEENTIERI